MIPDDWKVVRIQDIAEVNTDTLSSKSDPEYKYLYIELSAVNQGIITMPTERQDFTDLPSRARRVLHKGDVIMATVRPNLLGFAVCDFDPDDVICSTGFALLSPKGLSDSQFIYQSLYSDTVLRQLHGLVTGSNYPAINTSEVKKLELLWPQSETERQRIADIFSTWDEAIALTERRIEAARQRKKALMQRLLTGRVRFPEFEGEEWQKVKLSNLCSIATGKKDVGDGNPEGKFPFFTCAKQHTHSDSFSYDKEAILIPGNGILGYVHYFKGKFEAYQRTYILSDFNHVNVLYLIEYIKMFFPREIAREKHHSVMPYIRVALLRNFRVQLPSLPEQRRIAAALQTCDHEIDLLVQKRTALQRQKKGLMQRLLTGRVRVNV